MQVCISKVFEKWLTESFERKEIIARQWTMAANNISQENSPKISTVKYSCLSPTKMSKMDLPKMKPTKILSERRRSDQWD